MEVRRIVISIFIATAYMLFYIPIPARAVSQSQDDAEAKPISYRNKFDPKPLNKELKYIPNEIIVKFNEPAANRLTEKISQGIQVQQLNIDAELDIISGQYRIRRISRVFQDFRAQKPRGKELDQVDSDLLSVEQKPWRQRQNRAAPGEEIPELDRIFKMEFELEPRQTLQEVLNTYRNNPNVEYAEFNYVVGAHALPNDALFKYQWPLNNVGQNYPSSGWYNNPPGGWDNDIDALEAWDLHRGSSEIIYAVIDTGIDYGHRDLVNNLWFNSYEKKGVAGIDDDGNGYIDDIYGYDFLNDDASPFDDHGHGTHCAGIIAAEGNNVYDISGVCRDGQIMGLKFLGSHGFGSTADAVKALYYAVNNGADIISNSWGGDSYSEILQEAINYAYSQGVIFVASAGNDDTTIVQYPAGYDHVMAVAATDSDDEMAPFSNRGDWVDIAAPGVDILSLRATGTYFGLAYTQETTVASGTSMAGPHVTGACGLLLSLNPILSVDEITALLINTGDPITGGVGIPDKRLNVNKALLAAVTTQGKVSFDREIYSVDDMITITLTDGDLAGWDFQALTVQSGSSDTESVILQALPAGVGVFTQTILTSPSIPVLNDGVLQTFDGATIKVEYVDLPLGPGRPVIATDTALIDGLAPVISHIQFRIPGQEPDISFTTSEPTQVCLKAGTDVALLNNIVRYHVTPETYHTISLAGVKPFTDYFMVLEVVDEAGNKTVDDNHGAFYTFTTTGPGEIYVPADYLTIQEAILSSWDGGVVRVADGTYSGAGNRDIDFLHRSITVQSENGPGHGIIDCQGSESEPHRGFVFHRGEKYHSVLSGFTIRNGYARDQDGGGILCMESDPTIRNCHFIRNYADRFGGGLCCFDSFCKIQGCLFNGNQALAGGGVDGDFIDIDNCHFVHNQADYGGGLSLYHNTHVVQNCVFRQNRAVQFGGAIYCEASEPTIKKCLISENQSGNNGGGIYSWFNSSPRIENCIICANSAWDRGGGIRFTYGGSATINKCTIVSNSAAGGGGIHCQSGSNAKITNSIIWDNGEEQISFSSADLSVRYSNVGGGWTGLGNIEVDPLFVRSGYWDSNSTPGDPNDDFWVAGDYHLQSQGWRWDDLLRQWTWDEQTSRCIDAGNPSDALQDEPLTVMPYYPNKWAKNIRINMGAYSQTPQASLAVPGWSRLSDINNDGIVNLADWAQQGMFWLQNTGGAPGDLNRDGATNISDLFLLKSEWLVKTLWRQE